MVEAHWPDRAALHRATVRGEPDPVARVVDLEAAVDVLARWGVKVRPRQEPLDEGLLGNDIDRASYERPAVTVH